MNRAIEKLLEIEKGNVGIKIFSTKDDTFFSWNSDMLVPLASAAKVAIGFSVACWVEEGLFQWDDIVPHICFNPNEDSKELYPHFQHRRSLALREAVEVMIACHDSYVANGLVNFCGGWEKVNKTIQSYSPTLYVTENPRANKNKGQLGQLFDVMLEIFQKYKENPLIWVPLINGLVRQQGMVDEIPSYLLNHMTGGLENVILDFGILGGFDNDPILFALGAIELPNRSDNQEADIKIYETLKLLYREYLSQ
ncbi:serine hydrolase [Sutcliffiella rhizosphaerae]|uniref:serine hydrolase n=1 Tax=Sutcliffiella rhizosphaerae TaxID=2880967 RepID=UPI0037D9C796